MKSLLKHIALTTAGLLWAACNLIATAWLAKVGIGYIGEIGALFCIVLVWGALVGTFFWVCDQ